MSKIQFAYTKKLSVVSFPLVLLSIVATMLMNPVIASTNECYFPPIFNFGDSNTDTGGFAASFVQLPLPFGVTFFLRPAGRFCDGRLIIDFMAQRFGLPFLSPYLDSLGTNFSYGASFATAAATIMLPYKVIPQFSGNSPFYLDIQSTQFAQFKLRTQFIRQQGGIFANLMPKEEYFSKALYTFDIGQADLSNGFVGGMTPLQVNALVPMIVNHLLENVKNNAPHFKTLLRQSYQNLRREKLTETHFKILWTKNVPKKDKRLKNKCFYPLIYLRLNFLIYNDKFGDEGNIYILGRRSFWIHNTGPSGCLPYILVTYPLAEKDCYGCVKLYNEVAQNFNLKLKEAVVQLRKELPLAAITYVDIYSVKYSLFSTPSKYGFQNPLVSCCGYGGEYNYSNNVECGGTTTVNGIETFVGSCETPPLSVVWDGYHYTEAANKFVFDQISTGAFSDPPVPLKMACNT